MIRTKSQPAAASAQYYEGGYGYVPLAQRGSLKVEGVEGSLPDLISAYEELKVDQEFANKAYLETLAGLSGARAAAEHQARYLVPHIQPTLATTALYPRRATTASLIGLFLLLGWGIAILIYYNVRDNR